MSGANSNDGKDATPIASPLCDEARREQQLFHAAADHAAAGGMADSLSRLASPEGSYSVPASLHAVKRTFVPSRPISWHKPEIPLRQAGLF